MYYTASMRVLGRIRLSKEADEAGTSVERQRESIEAWAQMHGHEIVGWAHDTVSGSVSPFDTPELGKFLSSGLDSWDVLVAYRLDRLSRRVIPLNQLFGFAVENGKSIASVSESLDLSTWIGRLVANVIAGVAEGELEAISERNRGSQKKVRELGRWHGGTPPYGYISERRSTATQSGYYLVPQTAERDVIRNTILPRLLAYESATSIARYLTDENVPARRSHHWRAQTVLDVMRSRALLGQGMHKRRVLTDEDGLPLQRAEPILTPDEFDKVQRVLAERSVRSSPKAPNPLAGVVRCYWCSAAMYYQAPTGRQPALYRCAERGRGCKGLSIHAEKVLDLVAEQLLFAVGDVPRQAKVFIPGSGQSRSAEDIEGAIAVCRRERDLGLYEGDDEEYFKRLQALIGKRDQLQQLGPPRFEMKDLGETYGQAWERMDVEERRTMLLDSKITMSIGKKHQQIHGEIHVPIEIKDLLGSGATDAKRSVSDASALNAKKPPTVR